MHEGSGRFGGDMDRNEVEMDLNKFMSMIQEIGELKEKIRDLEDETNVYPWQKPDPNLEQSALVSVVVGAMGVVFGVYSGKSGQSKGFKGEDK